MNLHRLSSRARLLLAPVLTPGRQCETTGSRKTMGRQKEHTQTASHSPTRGQKCRRRCAIPIPLKEQGTSKT